MKTPSVNDLSWGLLALQSGLVTLSDLETALRVAPDSWIGWLESSGRVTAQQRQRLDALWKAYSACHEANDAQAAPSVAVKQVQQNLAGNGPAGLQRINHDDDENDDDVSVEASFLTLADVVSESTDPSDDDADISCAPTMNQTGLLAATPGNETLVAPVPAPEETIVAGANGTVSPLLRVARRPDSDDSLDCPTIQEGPSGSMSGGSMSGHDPFVIKSESRFSKLRFHAEGGMARVSEALEATVNRRVAFKEMKPDRPRSEREGFEKEARITGNLEHPNIVPIYNIGHYADGRPFYAMRFIQGESYGKRIRRFHEQRRDGSSDIALHLKKPSDWLHNAEFRDLLSAFMTVCQAIAFAHSKRYLHRDLKPENIMLGSFGETFVVDWGLARRIGAAGEGHSANGSFDGSESLDGESADEGLKTRKGQIKGTLKYMSPEQASGKHDELDAESDIYSLGVILFEILVGQPALGALSDGQSEHKLPTIELLRRIKNGTFKRPREIISHVPQGLEAICLKAMQLDPHMRYHSALDLAKDVAAWLADDPISVVPETRKTRAIRWLRRHQAVVGIGVLAAFGLASFLGVFLFLLSCKNADLKQAEQVASTARVAAEANEARAKEQELDALNAKQLAEDEKKKAQESAEQARKSEQVAQLRRLDAEEAKAIAQESLKTMQQLVSQIRHHPQDTQESLKLKTALLRTAFKGLKDVSEQVGQKTEQNRDAALAHRELGNLFLLMDVEGEQGGVSAAFQEFDKSRRILDTLRTVQPAASEVIRDLAITLEMLGETHLRMGRTDEAIRGCLEPCIELRKSVVPSDPANAEQQDREMSACEAKLGQAQLIAGRAEDALRRLVAATQSRMHHNKLHPELITDVGQRELAEWYASLGDANFSLGQKDEAAAAYESSIKVLDDFEAIQPQSVVARQGLASIYRRFSRQLSENGDQEQADRMNRFALAAAGSNAATMVASIGDPTMGAKSLNTDSDVSPGLFAGGGVFSPEREQAELNRTEVELEKRRRLLLAKGASRDALVNLAGAYSSLAASFNKAKLPDSGLRVSDQGIAIFRSVILRDSADSTMQLELARSLIQQCDTFILLERQDAAERVLKESQSLLQQLSTQDPLNQRLAYELLTLERRFGQIERLRGEHDRAKARYQKAALDLKSYIDRKLFVAAATQELKLINRAAKFNAECQVALSNWDELLTQPAELLPKLLSLRCTALRNGSDTTAVEQAAAKLATLEPPAAINHISSACGYGICLKILDRQTPSEELVKRRAALMQQALQQVKLGLQAGWTDLSYLKEEPDFAAFRDSEEFQNLLKEAAKPAAP